MPGAAEYFTDVDKVSQMGIESLATEFLWSRRSQQQQVVLQRYLAKFSDCEHFGEQKCSRRKIPFGSFTVECHVVNASSAKDQKLGHERTHARYQC